MSVVVGIKQDGKVYLGCDCQVTCGGIKKYTENPNNFKIWAVKGIPNCLMGSVGAVRDACVIRAVDGLVDELAVLHNDIDFNYVVNCLVPSIIEVLKHYNYITNDPNIPFDHMESAFLFAYQDKLWHIHNDGSVFEVESSVAIGSGEGDATGSLLTTENSKKVQDRIVKAIEATSQHDLYVSGPIIIMDTLSTPKFKIV